MRFFGGGQIVSLALAALLATAMQPAQAKKWTITERQLALGQRISSAENTGELTRKEADNLRDKLSTISEKINKYTSENGGRMSYNAQGKIEKRLNDVSVKIRKLKLEKRVTPR